MATPAASKPQTSVFEAFDPKYDFNPRSSGLEVVKNTTLLGPTGATCPLINTSEQIQSIVDMIVDLTPTKKPALYLDLEGRDLSKDGTIAIMQLLIDPLKTIFLIDVHTLGHDTFNTPGSDGTTTLRSIFESKTIPKVLFDCRNDSNALSFLFNVHLRCVTDLQVMQNCKRDKHAFLNGLSKSIEYDLTYSSGYAVRQFPIQIKNEGRTLFAPEKGGSYAVFEQRPLPLALVRYCAVDVLFMPLLWEKYSEKLLGAPPADSVDHHYGRRRELYDTPSLRMKNIELATNLRVLRSQTDEFKAEGVCKGLGPWADYDCREKRLDRSRKHCSEAMTYVYLGLEYKGLAKGMDDEELWKLALEKCDFRPERVRELVEWVEERY